MRNASLNEAQAGIRIAGRNISNLRYAYDITLIAENEELKSLLRKVKEEHGKMDWFQIRRGVQQAVFSFVMLIPSFEKHSFSFSCSILSLILIG